VTPSGLAEARGQTKKNKGMQKHKIGNIPIFIYFIIAKFASNPLKETLSSLIQFSLRKY